MPDCAVRSGWPPRSPSVSATTASATSSRRYIAGIADNADLRRKAMTALTAKMARVAHAVIKSGTEYRPFLERSDARWKDPSLQVP